MLRTCRARGNTLGSHRIDEVYDKPMPYAENDGVRIHYRVVGEGPPLVLQHGFGQSLKTWYLSGYVEALRQQFRLILIDSRGHGNSDKPYDPDAYALCLQVQDVVAILDQLKIEKAIFWGYSSGARVALGLAKWAPLRVAAMVIGGEDARARAVPPWLRINPDDPEKFLETIFDITNLDRERRGAVKRQEILTNDFKALAAAQQDLFSMEDVLPHIIQPCLFYAGEHDPVYPVVSKYPESMPNLSFAALPGLGHTSAFWKSKVVLECVLGFLQALAKENRSGADSGAAGSNAFWLAP